MKLAKARVQMIPRRSGGSGVITAKMERIQRNPERQSVTDSEKETKRTLVDSPEQSQPLAYWNSNPFGCNLKGPVQKGQIEEKESRMAS